MAVTQVAAAPLPAWDLSALYTGIEDPRVRGDMEAQVERAGRFAATYRGRIDAPDLTAERLLEATREYEAIHRAADRAATFAHLVYSADSSDPRHGALVQWTQEKSSAIRNLLVFFELEICAVPEERLAQLLADERLAPYRHYLEKEREAARFRLSEAEEKILEEKANSGARAFNRLFDETISNYGFRLALPGEPERRVTESEVLALLYDGDRERRRIGAESLTEGIRELHRVLGLTFNTLLLDKATNDRLRGFEYPEQARHLSNEIDREVVDTVAEVCVAGYPMVADYYRLKGKLLGIDRLTHYDRYAPITAAHSQIPYAQAKEMVLNAFGAFDAAVHDAAAGFFAERRIDAALREGKRGGAFCCSVDADHSPYVLMNYTARPRDVMTLAHELGHGVHGCLAQRQNYLNYHSVLPLAETASVFGEMLVFERLMAELPGDAERLALLCEKIEDTFATTFRQIALYRFEQQVHRRRREEGELAVATLNEIWQATIQQMFGDSVELGEDHAWWWLYIPHFVHSPFYVYAYAVGELLVLSLYARYRQEGKAFVPRYLDFLAAGGSRRPAELLADLGIDIRQRSFWEGGIALIADTVRQAHELAGRVRG